VTTTLITGSTGKFGRVLVADRLKRGDIVIAVASRSETLAALADRYAEAATNRRLVTVPCDLTALDAAQDIVEFCRREGVLPERVVNNARNLSYLKTSEDGRIRRADFLGELTLDVVSPCELTLALAVMPQSTLKRVVNIGSQYGVVAPNRALYNDMAREIPIHYGVAKAALIQLSRELAVRLAPRVQVNCISFGGVEGRADAAFQQRYAKLAPAGRMLREDEIVGPVEFLLSDSSSGMTGHNLVVDGGWTTW
jgi:NAD(P)-dependent dehydrogenase (short-subunit alcohol dehydrogenase family)